MLQNGLKTSQNSEKHFWTSQVAKRQRKSVEMKKRGEKKIHELILVVAYCVRRLISFGDHRHMYICLEKRW